MWKTIIMERTMGIAAHERPSMKLVSFERGDLWQQILFKEYYEIPFGKKNIVKILLLKYYFFFHYYLCILIFNTFSIRGLRTFVKIGLAMFHASINQRRAPLALGDSAITVMLERTAQSIVDICFVEYCAIIIVWQFLLTLACISDLLISILVTCARFFGLFLSRFL